MEFEGRIRTNPSTIYMDGTTPVVIHIHCDTDTLRWMHRKTVKIVIDEEYFDGPQPT